MGSFRKKAQHESFDNAAQGDIDRSLEQSALHPRCVTSPLRSTSRYARIRAPLVPASPTAATVHRQMITTIAVGGYALATVQPWILPLDAAVPPLF